MNLIIGGAYQGKLDFAKNKFSLSDEQIFHCIDNLDIDFNFICINHIENFVLYCIKNNLNALEIFRANKPLWQDSILISNDIFCGVVPISAEARAWREATGHLLAYLSQEADTVTRIFCGLEQKLK